MGFQCNFDKLKDENDSLEDFYLYKFYEEFNKENDIDDHNSYCNSHFTTLEDGGLIINDLCAKLRRNFSKLSNIEPSLSKQDGCRYLKFWLNDQIISYEYNYNIISPLIEKWDTFENLSSSEGRCGSDDILVDYYNSDVYNIHHEAFYVMEIIFEYLKKRDAIRKTVDIHNINIILNDIKDSYITDNFPLYNKIKDICSKSDSGHLCKIYNKCKNQYGAQLLELESKIGTYQIAEAAEIERSRLVKELSDVTRTSSTSGGSIAAGVICSFLGLLLSSLILYKFTPLGSRLRLKMGRKENMWNNIGEEDDIFQNDPESFNRKSKNRPYNLIYHSVQN
ncbi:PIR Superfamily Protein [Plasmodium ovale wallikeri]|uniref:PIR Superfamily Protein n=1 Tax=Plasmodium ovale wallikeri TaxID=864142 RepID=A0A1A9AP72_PLAOA|nr:PIR Superfamily Protein [Plasmodium ovale wallikeri]